MTDERYNFLMGDDCTGADITAEERAEKWHYCCEFDGLLVGPGMDEMKHCDCFNPENR